MLHYVIHVVLDPGVAGLPVVVWPQHSLWCARVFKLWGDFLHLSPHFTHWQLGTSPATRILHLHANTGNIKYCKGLLKRLQRTIVEPQRTSRKTAPDPKGPQCHLIHLHCCTTTVIASRHAVVCANDCM